MASDDISFRRIDEADLARIRAWRNSPDVARFMYSDHEISDQEHRAWFDRVRRDPTASYWIIELAGRPVGLANIVDIDFARKSASWAFYIADPRTRGKGVGQFVEYCVLSCVFDHWQLDALNCQVLASNPDVSALHVGVGFREVARLPGRVIRDGSPIDALAYSMDRTSWASTHRQRLEERIQAKGREPRPLLGRLEAEEARIGVSPRMSANAPGH
jgi:UDP-4-amino-4,6-dideoxy-N-acetyl-beta-L-altrosamine N-acetyltransferase